MVKKRNTYEEDSSSYLVGAEYFYKIELLYNDSENENTTSFTELMLDIFLKYHQD